MPDGLYEVDALAWAETQASLLRRLVAGERVNELVDWANVIEEVNDVGLSELHSCESLLQQAMVYALKLHAWPNSHAVSHWRGEMGTFVDQVSLRLAPSMRQRIDLARLYTAAVKRVLTASDSSGIARAVPPECPFRFDTLLAGDLEPLLAEIEDARRANQPTP